ncbi:MAG: Lrp/AsnC family transcriptional regulator [Treponema sp.]|jgi:Lrp/AsnC family leucine-responsive transcriptional regulator|nr:Lrp/AsnC family transcriptional regulator [Treponema sp.]
MDDFDKKIVTALQKNARASLTELSRMVHLSLPAVRTRLLKLQEQGYFSSFSAILDPEKFGKGFTCYCLIQLNGHDRFHEEIFEKFVIESQDILECHRIAGQYEYLLKIITRSSKHMEEILKKMRNLENVVNTNTLTVLHTMKEEPSVKPD